MATIIGLLVVGVPLLRPGNDRGVDDLPAHGQIAGPGEVLVETDRRACRG